MRKDFSLNDQEFELEINPAGESFEIIVNDNKIKVTKVQDGLYRVVNGTEFKSVAVVKSDGKWLVEVDSHLFEIHEPGEDDFQSAAGDHAAEKDKIYAPMPGKIVKVLVSEGEKVSEKQPLVIVEAMKMENQILSKANGTVKSVNCSTADQVDTEIVLIELDIEE